MSLLLLTEAQLKDYCPVGSNVQWEYGPRQSVRAVQDTYLRPLLCEDFFDEVIAQFALDSLSADNQVLYDDYIVPFLAWKSYWHFAKTKTYQTRDNGVASPTGQNFGAPDLAAVNSVLQHALSQAGHYEAALRKRLKDYAELYPTRTCCDGGNVLDNYVISV